MPVIEKHIDTKTELVRTGAPDMKKKTCVARGFRPILYESSHHVWCMAFPTTITLESNHILLSEAS